jgi:hypothetical protein
MDEQYHLFFGSPLGSVERWMALLFFAWLLFVVSCRPQQINSHGMFTIACVLFVLYILVPGGVNLFLVIALEGKTPVEEDVLYFVSGWFGRLLFGLSILFAINALQRRRPPPLDSPPPQ